jgi:hypothetical protein
MLLANNPVAANGWVPRTETEAFRGATEMEVRLATVPVPARLTVCGLVLALSVTVSVPLDAPSCVGVNVTLIMH